MQWDERIGRRLRLKDLHTLQAIVEAGSMARAAERLGVSQPAISKAVAELEHVLGVPVLDRTPRGVDVTEYGRVLLKHASTVFDDLRQGLAEIDYLRDPTQGDLRVGAPEPLAQLLSTIIGSLSESAPRIRFHVMSEDTAVLFGALRERQLDIALTRVPDGTADSDLDTQELFQDPLVVVAGVGHPLARRRTVSLLELAGHAWVLPPAQTVLGRFGGDIFRDRGLEPPKPAVVAASLLLRLNLVGAGSHLTLLPQAMLRYPGAQPQMRALPVALDETTRPVALLKLRQRHVSPLLQAFIRKARAVTIARDATRRSEAPR